MWFDSFVLDAIYIDLQYLELFVPWLWAVGCRGLCLWWSVKCVACLSGCFVGCLLLRVVFEEGLELLGWFWFWVVM